MKQKDIELVKHVSEIIEYIIEHCEDKELLNAVELMYLESLTNNPEEVKSYLPLLGSKSKEICRELDKFWETNTPGIYD